MARNKHHHSIFHAALFGGSMEGNEWKKLPSKVDDLSKVLRQSLKKYVLAFEAFNKV